MIPLRCPCPRIRRPRAAGRRCRQRALNRTSVDHLSRSDCSASVEARAIRSKKACKTPMPSITSEPSCSSGPTLDDDRDASPAAIWSAFPRTLQTPNRVPRRACASGPAADRLDRGGSSLSPSGITVTVKVTTRICRWLGFGSGRRSARVRICGRLVRGLASGAFESPRSPPV